ncbi:hypothetical protein V6Z11_1Z080900, partial [Gossypium hirsutum]
QAEQPTTTWDRCVLVTSFAVLGIRSLNQQNVIESLEAQKDSLTKSNKALKKVMWDWKQQLFAEASSPSPLVPLDSLKAIYGESPTPPTGDSAKGVNHHQRSSLFEL